MLERELADQPGVQTNIERELALAFAHLHAKDFEGVFWLQCANRSRAGILGDLAYVLGMRLSGPVEQNERTLRQFCVNRRLLLIFESNTPAETDWLTFEGLTSVIFAVGPTNTSTRSLAETAALFSNWRSNSDACFAALADAQKHLRISGANSHSVALSAFSFLKHAGRLAEAYEFLDPLIQAALARGDRATAVHLQSEKNWILWEWGKPEDRAREELSATQAVQMSLF